MDHNEERRKALEHIAPNLSQRYPFGSAYATSSNSSSGAVPDAPDQVRYRTPGLNLPPSGSGSLPVEGSYSESSGTENIASSQSYHREATSAFPASNMSQTMLGYGQNYGTDSRGHTAPGFPGYGGNGMTMYNIQGHAAAQGPVYGAQQFNQRHSTSVQMLPTDTASAYFHMAPGAGSLQSMNQNPEEDMYAHQGANISYQDNVRRTDDAQGATASASSVDQAPASQPGTLSAHDAVEEKLANYKQQLGTVFQDITRGQLARAAETLLYLSNWLLPQITELGFHLDDRERHKERLRLWEDFNNAWLALTFKQKELMSSPFATPHESLMTEDTIEELGDELIRLCDGIERHGLVDYQYGVWEERIEAVLEDCLDLFESAARDRSR